MRNIEVKAHLRDRLAAAEALQRFGAVLEGELRQTDTFFAVPRGRLKLRECGPGTPHLIYYERRDAPTARPSDYWIAPAAPALKDLLARALGVIGVVDKIRTLYLWDNVRIHLDAVQGLGAFIEIEAVLDDSNGDGDGHAKIGALKAALGIPEDDLVSGAYLDLLGG